MSNEIKKDLINLSDAEILDAVRHMTAEEIITITEYLELNNKIKRKLIQQLGTDMRHSAINNLNKQLKDKHDLDNNLIKKNKEVYGVDFSHEDLKKGQNIKKELLKNKKETMPKVNKIGIW